MIHHACAMFGSSRGCKRYDRIEKNHHLTLVAEPVGDSRLGPQAPVGRMPCSSFAVRCRRTSTLAPTAQHIANHSNEPPADHSSTLLTTAVHTADHSSPLLASAVHMADHSYVVPLQVLPQEAPTMTQFPY